jgi:hypothetical protein
MFALIDSLSGLIGGPAALSVLALLLIWGLFLLLDIKVRRRRMRFAGVFLLGISLSMMLGLTKPELLQGENAHGGALGDWIYLNCKLVGMVGLAAFLAWIATIASILLATDWLFIEYITNALGLAKPGTPRTKKPEPAPLPQARTPEPVSRPRPMTRKEPTQELVEKSEEPPAPVAAEPEAEAAEVKSTKVSPGIPVDRAEEKDALPTNEWWIAAAGTTRPQKVEEQEEDKEEEVEDAELEADTDEEEQDGEPSESEDEEWEYEEDEEEESDEEPDEEAGGEEDEYEYEYVEEEVDAPEDETIEYEEAEEPEEEEIYPDEVVSEETADEEAIQEEADEAPAQSAAVEAGESTTSSDYADPFARALLLVFEEQEASISLLQKKLGIGYTQAAKWIDRLEKEGVVSAPGENGTRSVIITKDALNKLVDSAERNPSESKSI